MNQNKLRGIGTDIIRVSRIREALHTHKERMQQRLFTEAEIAYCIKFKDPAIHFAGRFSAKEAVAKALGTGLGKDLSWQDIEIGHAPSGQPIVILSERARHTHNNPQILLSISHCEEYATATAVVLFS